MSAPSFAPCADPRIRLVCIEGVIGVGKSTFVRQVIERADIDGVRVIIVEEPVDMWEKSGALKAFYSNPKEEGARFQHYTFSTRIGAFCKAYAKAMDLLNTRACDGVLLVSERSWYTDRYVFKNTLAADGAITPLQSRMYDEQFDSWMLAVGNRLPDLVLLLDIAKGDRLEETMRRIKKRARPGETVSAEYQQRLFAAHDEVYGGGKFYGAPVLKVDLSLDYSLAENAAAAEAVVGALDVLFS